MAVNPFDAANISAVRPSWFFAVGAAPASSNAATTPSCPSADAMSKGVQPVATGALGSLPAPSIVFTISVRPASGAGETPQRPPALLPGGFPPPPPAGPRGGIATAARAAHVLRIPGGAGGGGGKRHRPPAGLLPSCPPPPTL